MKVTNYILVEGQKLFYLYFLYFSLSWMLPGRTTHINLTLTSFQWINTWKFTLKQLCFLCTLGALNLQAFFQAWCPKWLHSGINKTELKEVKLNGFYCILASLLCFSVSYIALTNTYIYILTWILLCLVIKKYEQRYERKTLLSF